jgi:hypothetical protein
VSEDDTHRDNIDDRSVRAFAVKPRAFGSRGYAALGLERSTRPSKPAVPPMRCSYDAARLSDNVRQSNAGFLTFDITGPITEGRVLINLNLFGNR